MQIGLGIGIPFKRNAILTAFNPSNLFNAGEQGVWYDPSDFDRYMSALGPLGPDIYVLKADSYINIGDTTSGWLSSTGVKSLDFVAVRANSAYLVKPVGGQADRLRIQFEISGSSYVYDTAQSGDTTWSEGRVIRTPANATRMRIYFASAAATATALTVRELTAIDTATLFQDSAGTTPVTAVEQPVGLMLDKSKGLVLGNELASGWLDSSSGWTLDSGWSITSGAVVGGAGANSTYASKPLTTVAGRWYKVDINVASLTGTLQFNIRQDGVTGPTLAGRDIANQTGTFSLYFLAATTTSVLRFGDFLSSVSINAISICELPGNHAFQATSTSRPVLSARYNLLERTEEFDNLYWSKTNATVSQNTETSPSGSLTADTFTATGANAVIFRSQSGTSGSFTFSVYLKRKTGSGNVSIEVGASSQVVAVTNQWQQFAITGASNNFPGIRLAVSGDEVYIWGADLRVTNDALNQPAYQRVNTATDYDSTGFKPYLRFDGTDDWLQTNSIDFTATDKMTVFAGVRKLSDAAAGMLVELSASRVTNPNSFSVLAPGNLASNERYVFGTRGSTEAFAITMSASFTAPITHVLTGIGDISGDSAILRLNGVQAASSTADQGTGNYGNYPLYIGRRGGTTLPFNGRLYGLIVRGAQSTAQQITNTETWMNQKTGAY